MNIKTQNISNKCSSKSKSMTKEKTCMTKDEIISLLKEITKTNPGFTCSSLNKYKKEVLIDLLRKNTQTLGTEEHNLWKYIQNNQDLFFKMFYTLYKPQRKKTTKTWLDSSDIDRIVYQNIHDQGSFIGTFSCDHFSKDRGFKMKRGSGMILNTTGASEKGEHWVSLYLDKKMVLYYFDPVGDLPNKCITNFIDKKIKPIKKIYNHTEFQKKDGTCGDFCIIFITNMINYGNYDKIKKNTEDSLNKFVRCSLMY